MAYERAAEQGTRAHGGSGSAQGRAVSRDLRFVAAMTELRQARARLAAIEGSRSWRLTAPLRGRRDPAPAAPPAAVDRDPAGPLPPPPPAGRAALIALRPGAPWPAADAGVTMIADVAAADFVVLWDGISVPSPGWLDALAATFTAFPRAGMVGAVLRDAAGRIDAAGCAIGVDGALLPLGAGLAAEHPDIAAAAAVEAPCVGAVMLPRELWQRLGGLDPEIASLPHALAELALRVADAGRQVVRQPAAHLRAGDAAEADAWTTALGAWHLRRAIAGGGWARLLQTPRRLPPRVLVVDHFVPRWDRDAGSADLHALLRSFVAFGWQPTLLPLDALAQADGYVDALRRDGVRVASGGPWRDLTQFLAAEPLAFDLLIVCRASLAGSWLLRALRAQSPLAPLLFNTVDLHFLRLEREAMLTRSAAGLAEALRVQSVELAAVAAADRTLVVSQTERDLLARLLPGAAVEVMPLAFEVPGRTAPFAPRRGVVFVGGFSHAPNVDAVLHFVRDIWPLVAGRIDATLSIVGAAPPPEVTALAGPRVAVLGHVADLGALLAGCRLTVAPLRFGAGIKGKVITSLAAGVPCVATAVAAESMGLQDGVTARIADDPAGFADAVVALHEDAAVWQAVSDAGLAHVAAHFSLAAGRRRLAALLGGLGLPVDAPT